MDGIGRLKAVETGYVVGKDSVMTGDSIEGVASLDQMLGPVRQHHPLTDGKVMGRHERIGFYLSLIHI